SLRLTLAPRTGVQMNQNLPASHLCRHRLFVNMKGQLYIALKFTAITLQANALPQPLSTLYGSYAGNFHTVIFYRDPDLFRLYPGRTKLQQNVYLFRMIDIERWIFSGDYSRTMKEIILFGQGADQLEKTPHFIGGAKTQL